MPQLSDERGNGGPGSAQESEAPIKTRRLATTLSDERPQSTLSDRAVAPQEVTQAVETMQSHLSQTFDHQIGRLGRPMENDEAAVAPAVSAAARTESPATAPGEMAAMLRDLSNIRDAIVVSEILRRPEERW